MPKHMPVKKSTAKNPFTHIKNLVLQGGGVKGLGYLGAIEELTDSTKESHVELAQIERVCGASAGAITAFFLALGYGPDRLEEELVNFELLSLLDDDDLQCGETVQYIALKVYALLDSEIAREIGQSKLVCYLLYEMGFKAGIDFATETTVSSIRQNHPNFYQQISGFVGFLNWLAPKTMQSAGEWLTTTTINNIDAFLQNILEKVADIRIQEIREKITDYYRHDGKSNPQQFLDTLLSGLYEILGIIWQDAGLFSGEDFIEILEEKLESNALPKDITFAEFARLRAESPSKQYKDLYVVALNLSIGRTQIFSAEHTPYVVMADAVRISMSFPYVFKPYRIREKTAPNRYRVSDKLYTDGGALDNYPVWVFDRVKYLRSYSQPDLPIYNDTTLGLRLVPPERWKLYEQDMLQSDAQYEVKYPAGAFLFTKALLSSMFNKQESDYYHSGNYKRTVHISDLGLQTLQFHMSFADKQRLIQSGRDGVHQYRRRIYHPVKEVIQQDVRPVLSQAIHNSQEPTRLEFFAQEVKREEQDYTPHSVAADGDCGYTAFGITRQDALKRLMTHLNTVKHLLWPAVRHALLKEEFYVYLAQCTGINASHQHIVDNIERYAKKPAILKTYLNYDVRDKQIDAGWAHPCVLQALAHIRGITLRIWEHNPQGTLAPHHKQEYARYIPPNANLQHEIDLLFVNGNHFELLEFKNRAIRQQYEFGVHQNVQSGQHERIKSSEKQAKPQAPAPIIATAPSDRRKQKVSISTQTIINKTELRNKLIFECKRGNYGGVKRIIHTGLWSGEPDYTGEWPLSAAIWGGNPKVVQYLCDKLGSEALTWERYARFNVQKYSATSRLESDWETAVGVFKNFEGLYLSQNIFLQYVFEAVLRMTADTVLVPITLGGRKKAPISISAYKEQLKRIITDNESATQIVKVNGVYNPHPNNPPSNASISIMLRVSVSVANEWKLDIRGNRVMFSVRGANNLWDRQQVSWLDEARPPTHRRIINIMNDVFKRLISNAEVNQKKSPLVPLRPSEPSSCAAETATYTQKDWAEMEVYYKGLQGVRLSQHTFLRQFIDVLLEKTRSSSLLKQLKQDIDNNEDTAYVRKVEFRKDKQHISIVFRTANSVMDEWLVRITGKELQLFTHISKSGRIDWVKREDLIWADKENFSTLQRINDINCLAQERAVMVGKPGKPTQMPYTAAQAFFSDIGSREQPQERAKQAFTFLQDKMTHFWVFDSAVFDECSRRQQSSRHITFSRDKKNHPFANFRHGSYLEIPDNQFLDFSTTTQFSIEMWAKPVRLERDKDNVGSDLLTRNINKGGLKVIGVSWNKDHRFVIRSHLTKPHRYYNSRHVFSPNQYYHLALTYDGTRIRLYVNGICEVDQKLTIFHKPGSWNIGSEVVRLQPNHPRNWNGEIRCIRTYHTALPSEHIETLSKNPYLTYASLQPGTETYASELAEAGSNYGHH